MILHYEEANEDNPLPDKVTITVGGKSNTYDVELKVQLKLGCLM